MGEITAVGDAAVTAVWLLDAHRQHLPYRATGPVAHTTTTSPTPAPSVASSVVAAWSLSSSPTDDDPRITASLPAPCTTATVGAAPGLNAIAEASCPSTVTEWVRTCAECVPQGHTRPELTDPFALAQAIWPSVHGLVSLLIMTGDVPEQAWRKRDVVLDVLMTMIDRGVMRPRS